MKLATIYNAKNIREGEIFATFNTEDSMTQQSDVNETDINFIVEKYSRTGQIPQVQVGPLYGDFTGDLDYRNMVEQIAAANAAFHEIPAKIRKEFDNDPAQFIEYANNPANLEKLREWGLATTPPPKTATLDDVVNELRSQQKEPSNGTGQK